MELSSVISDFYKVPFGHSDAKIDN